MIRRSSSSARPTLPVDDASDTDDVLQQVILTLPAVQRSVLVLADVADCSYDTIAAITETDRATVRRRLARARCTMRDTIETLSLDGR